MNLTFFVNLNMFPISVAGFGFFIKLTQ